MSYTPGPWHIESRAGHAASGYRDVIFAKGRPRIAVVSQNGVPTEVEASANARLIAAAPALLDTCRTLAYSLHAKIQSQGGVSMEWEAWALDLLNDAIEQTEAAR